MRVTVHGHYSDAPICQGHGLPARTAPSRYAHHRATQGEEAGGLYLDISRNSCSQSSVAPYGVRARPGAPVATPLLWEELDDQATNAQRYHILDLPARLDEMGDPWQAALTRSPPSSLAQARSKLDELLAATPSAPA